MYLNIEYKIELRNSRNVKQETNLKLLFLSITIYSRPTTRIKPRKTTQTIHFSKFQ